jgi:hypothetical protein
MLMKPFSAMLRPLMTSDIIARMVAKKAVST